MADNIQIRDATGTARTVATVEESEVHEPRHRVRRVDGSALPSEAKQDTEIERLEEIRGRLPETGAASEAKQDTEIARLEAVRDRVGATDDAEATGNGTINAILKRIRTVATAVQDRIGATTVTAYDGGSLADRTQLALLKSQARTAYGEELRQWHEFVPDPALRSRLEGLGMASVYALTQRTATVTISGASALRVRDMRGLEYLVRMTNSLRLENHGTGLARASMLPPLITDLRITTHGLEEIDVSHCVNLTVLRLNVGNLTTIGSVRSLVALTDIRLNSNQLSQATLETIIDELHANRVALGSNSCNILLGGNPGSAGAEASRSDEIAALISEGCSVTI